MLGSLFARSLCCTEHGAKGSLAFGAPGGHLIIHGFSRQEPPVSLRCSPQGILSPTQHRERLWALSTMVPSSTTQPSHFAAARMHNMMGSLVISSAICIMLSSREPPFGRARRKPQCSLRLAKTGRQCGQCW